MPVYMGPLRNLNDLEKLIKSLKSPEEPNRIVTEDKNVSMRNYFGHSAFVYNGNTSVTGEDLISPKNQ
ncbi:MAG: hypothetical protein ACE5J4_02870 [Candidatus Aenigmatarchaeota archaeon]